MVFASNALNLVKKMIYIYHVTTPFHYSYGGNIVLVYDFFKILINVSH